jgi:hypothetical protein
MSLRDSLLATRNAADVPLTPAPPTPEWPAVDGRLFLGTLSEADLGSISSSGAGQEADEGLFRAGLVCKVLRDANANRVLQDSDAPAMAAKETLVMERLYHAAREANGLTEENRRGFLPTAASTAQNGSPTSSPAPSAAPPMSTGS